MRSTSKARDGAAKPSGDGRLQRQQLELDVQVLVKEFERDEARLVRESSAWDERVKEAAARLSRMERKLASYPQRFLQRPEDVRKAIRSLEDERDALEGRARKERAALFEALHKVKTDLALLDAEESGVDQELMEVTSSLKLWQSRALQEQTKIDAQLKTRKALLAKVAALHEGRGVEKVTFDKVKVRLSELEGPLDLPGYAGVVAMTLAPYYEPDFAVSSNEVEKVVGDMLGLVGMTQEAIEGITFEVFCRVVDSLKSGGGLALD
jgi:chromosome segregation ATPase